MVPVRVRFPVLTAVGVIVPRDSEMMGDVGSEISTEVPMPLLPFTVRFVTPPVPTVPQAEPSYTFRPTPVW